MIKILFLQLFWFSFLGIGLALFLILRRLKVVRTSAFYGIFARLPLLMVALLLSVFGLAFFALPLTLAYIFEWPLAALSDLYLVMLGLALLIISLHARYLMKKAVAATTPCSRETAANGLLIAAALGVAYLISLRIGSPLINDTPVHLSKIQLMLNNSRFSLTDGYVGYNGISDFRYSTNLLSGLQVIAAHVLHWPAYLVWKYSDAFLQLLIWLGLYALSWTFLPKEHRRAWATIVLVLSPFIYTGYFFQYAILSHLNVLIWVCLLLIGFKYLLTDKSWFLLLLTAVLIAETHAFLCLVTVLFIALFAVCAFLIPKVSLSRYQLKILIFSMIVLCAPLLVTYLAPATPSGKTAVAATSTLNVSDGLQSLSLVQNTWKGLTYPDLAHFLGHNHYLHTYGSWLSTLGAILVVGFALLSRRYFKGRTRLPVIILLAALGLAITNVLFISLFGYWYFIAKTRDPSTKLLVGLTVIYFPIVAFNPAVLTLAHHANQPLWMIARFEDFNMFSYAAPIIGILWIFSVFAKKWGYPSLSNGYILLPLIFIVGFWTHSYFPLKTSYITTLGASQRSVIKGQYDTLAAYQVLNPYLKNQIVVTNDLILTVTQPLAAQGKFGGYLNYSLADPAQNSALRTSCQIDLFTQGLSLNDLVAAHISRVVLLDSAQTFPPPPKRQYLYSALYQVAPPQPLIAEAEQKPYLKLLAHTQQDYVFAIQKQNVTPSKRCQIPYGE